MSSSRDARGAAAGSREAPSEVNRLYVVATWVPRRETIVVGALGPVTFARGWHAYVGSAGRGRDARVARHQRAAKPLRWHADYLFARHPASRAWLLDTPLSECELAARLRATGPGGDAVGRGNGVLGSGPITPGGQAATAGARFGASDCGCAGHLLRAPRLGALLTTIAAVPGAGSRPWSGPAGARRRRP